MYAWGGQGDPTICPCDLRDRERDSGCGHRSSWVCRMYLVLQVSSTHAPTSEERVCMWTFVSAPLFVREMVCATACLLFLIFLGVCASSHVYPSGNIQSEHIVVKLAWVCTCTLERGLCA